MKDREGGLLCSSEASLRMHFMQIRKYALLRGPRRTQRNQKIQTIYTYFHPSVPKFLTFATDNTIQKWFDCEFFSYQKMHPGKFTLACF